MLFFTLRKRANIFILLETQYIHEESKAIQFRLNFINMMIVYIFGFLNLMLELLQLWTLNHPHGIINSFIYLEFSMKIFWHFNLKLNLHEIKTVIKKVSIIQWSKKCKKFCNFPLSTSLCLLFNVHLLDY